MRNLTSDHTYSGIIKWFSLNKNKANHFFALAALLVTASSVFQDFLFSEVNNTGFYLSEVLLFKIFWIFFIPFSYLIFFVHRKLFRTPIKKGYRIPLLILTIVIVLTIHIMVSSILISFFGNTWFGFRITVWQLATTKLIDYLGVAFLFYILAMWVAEYTNQTREQIKRNKEETEKKSVSIITIREGKKVIPIDISEIKWIKSDKPYVAIQTEKGKYLHISTLKKILNEIDNPNFVRIHRSTIVNISKIEKLVSRLNGDYDVLMKCGRELRLSRNYKTNLEARFF
ncbi:MAG: LytTR family DNA-binding domain-containing protein [Balneola sp.]